MGRVIKNVLIFAAALTMGTAVFGQQNSVYLYSGEATYGQVFAEIERQTGYKFAFDNATFDVSRRVRVPGGQMPLNQALGQLLYGTGHSFNIVQNHIVITGQPAGQDMRKEPGQSSSAPTPLPMEPEVKTSPASRDAQPRGPFKFETNDLTVYTPGIETGRVNERSPYASPGRSVRPKAAIKTNLVYWATLTPNIGVEIGTGKKTTLNIHAGYNPWNLNGTEANNNKLVHWVAQPEFRYWTCERFNGHFFGVHGLASMFNVSGKNVPMVFEKDFRYQGYAYGGGISYGYHLMLSRVMGLEFTVGAGMLYMEYDKYTCEKCSDEFLGRKSKTYFGPTKLGVTLVFVL